MFAMNRWHLLICFAVCSLWAVDCAAQELTPRTYWPAPKGTRVFVTGYSYASGDVLFDSSIPITGADSKVNSGILAYVQTLGLWGRTSNFLVELPYAWGTSKGLVAETPASRDFSDFGDLSVSLNVNLRGAPSMTREEFMALRADPHLILGASLKVVVPTGQYDPNLLVNVGTNRWAVRAQLGAIIPLRPKWMLELTAGAWFFGDDDAYIAGKKEQKPIYSVQTNLIKRIRPGLWASLDLSWYEGGRQTIDGDPLNDTQRNLKVGGTIVVPFRGRHAIKIGYGNGVITRFGSDFEQVLVSYQVALR
jgi:hypothetical protein